MRTAIFALAVSAVLLCSCTSPPPYASYEPVPPQTVQIQPPPEEAVPSTGEKFIRDVGGLLIAATLVTIDVGMQILIGMTLN